MRPVEATLAVHLRLKCSAVHCCTAIATESQALVRAQRYQSHAYRATRAGPYG